MFADVYYDTYKQYKAATKTVVQWLAATAETLRPTARPSSQQAKAQPITLPVDVLPQLAQQIADNEEGIPSVPRHILQTLRSVISGRKACAAFHSAKGTGESPSDSGHRHFVGVLEDVQHILRNLDPCHTSSSLDRDEPAPSDDGDSVTNLFEHLELHDLPDLAGEAEDGPAPTKAKKCAPVPQYNVTKSHQDDLEESFFAATCFVRDVDRIREHLRTLWRGYRERNVSITVASITTNLALAAIQRMHCALAEDFPRCSTYEGLYNLIYKKPIDFSWPENTITNVGVPRLDYLGSHVLLPGHRVFIVLVHQKKVREKGKFQDSHSRDNGFDWVLKCADGLPYRKQDVVTQILSRLIPDMIGLIREIGGTSRPVDQLTAYIWDFFQSANITMPLIIALEVFLDTLFVLGGDVSSPFALLREAAAGASAAVARYQVHTKEVLKCDSADPEVAESMGRLEFFISNHVSTDLVARFRKRLGFEHKGITPFCLLKHHPALCGTILHYINNEMYYLGLCATHDWKCMMSVIHLYNAAQQTGLLLKRWADIETVIGFYGSAEVFLVKRESRKKSAHKKSRPLHAKRRASRYMDFQTPLLKLMRSRDGENSVEQSSAALFDAEQVVNTMAAKVGTVTGDTGRILQQWKDRKVVTPLELLKLIQHGVELEEPQHQFDFLGLNYRCIELLRRTRDHLQEFYSGFKACANNKVLYMVVQTILQDEQKRGGLRASGGTTGAKGEITLLPIAAQRMDTLITSEGWLATKKMKELCSQPTPVFYGPPRPPAS
ncbi:uncharacterized protein LTR77_004890 [Saxophila tyrrhenica]|uniref:DUF6604 domain-containing protein n=1 Tax=Saxophila tyrrhenica TaxID=1690608 RepID=A0AAV9PEP6_9PEZI|nr:hypothetical protein LTR77_004890 [Saxophila tyrrhenica]